jgi:methyl-accepting chemotaxis protein
MGSKKKKFADILLRAMQSVPADRFDYLAFRKELRNPAYESREDKYQQAFAAVAKNGATMHDALQMARSSADALQEEARKFREVLGKQREEKVRIPQARAEQVAQEIRKKNAEIQRLKSEVEELQVQLSQDQDAAEEAADTIRSTATDFQSALTLMMNQVQEDIEHIKKHLSD